MARYRVDYSYFAAPGMENGPEERCIGVFSAIDENDAIEQAVNQENDATWNRSCGYTEEQAKRWWRSCLSATPAGD